MTPNEIAYVIEAVAYLENHRDFVRVYHDAIVIELTNGSGDDEGLRTAGWSEARAAINAFAAGGTAMASKRASVLKESVGR